MSNDPKNPTVINIHGFPRTRQFISYNEWVSYVSDRIGQIVSKQSPLSFGGRMTISEFLSKPHFAESKINNKEAESRRVKEKSLDPLPPYDEIKDGFAKTGVRKSDYYLSGMKRREWGFREKILHGYPEYKPWMAEVNISPFAPSFASRKIIFGMVTAGSGVFGGIPSISGISPTNTEILRSVELGAGRSSDTPFIPTGLCFIQDETGGLGIALGTDIRYVYHPSIYKTDYANPSITVDQMHAGSMVIPKADYRQFLRVGDLVAIEVGVNFKYWHSVLGAEPRYWEELVAPQFFEGSGNIRTPDGRPYVNNWGANDFPSSNIDYIRDSDLGRDGAPKGIYGNTYGYYPYQEDHPWYSGTPIPVNTGMPYVMMQQFIVDDRDRMSPPPLVILNSELRGFPKEGTVFSDGYVLNDISRLGEVNPDTAWFYDGPLVKSIKPTPPPNPWTENPGSIYKGMLVQLKNVRFVQPPKKKMYRVRFATKDGRTLRDGSIVGSVDALLSEINRVNEFLASGVPLSEITIPFIGSSGIRDLFYSGFENYNRILESIMTNNFVDARGYMFNDNPLNLYGRLNGNISPGDSFEFLITKFISDIVSSVADFFTFGLTSKILDLVPGLFPETPGWDPWDRDIDISKYLQYEEIEVGSPFPKSLDDNDGGYWWADPNIPLTNANSHYKDYKDTTGFLDANRNQFTQQISSNKLPELRGRERYVRDLGHTYSSSYAPFAEEWKPSTMVNGQLIMNNFEPIPENSYFLGNRIYYVVDEKNVVVPIRINANTEIARFNLPIPTGLCDITGIAWQYSLGKPGLEWEREPYVMQVWPRFASDILEYRSLPDSRDRKSDDVPELQSGGEDPNVRTPVLLKDRSIDLGDSIPLTQISTLNCEVLNQYFDSNNSVIRRFGGGELQGCDGLKPNESVFYIVSSPLWYGLTRIFRFMKDSGGNCNCEGPLPFNTTTNP